MRVLVKTFGAAIAYLFYEVSFEKAWAKRQAKAATPVVVTNFEDAWEASFLDFEPIDPDVQAELDRVLGAKPVPV